ncbi:CEL6 protein [Coprinopsis cinerea AmutBmut pab1-1]|nr:CEL6 protein [Coprinopsis cinerea AmutBmut pab1-1]
MGFIRPQLLLLGCLLSTYVAAAPSLSYTWKNVKIGGGGGFVPGIVFNTKEKGLAYARTDIGGAYRLNPEDHTWTPLLEFVDDERWNWWGVDALATDPVDPNRVYLATGMYTNSWDPNNGQILISADRGNTWNSTKLPFKVGGNMPGRGMGERLAIDPHSNNILYFGARSGNGLWKSIDYGASWTNVTQFPSVGTYIPVPGDSNDYNTDIVGISWVTFDETSGQSGQPTPRIFVGVANKGSDNIFVSEDGGNTWSAVPGQNNAFLPHKGVLSPVEQSLYLSYSDGAGPYDGGFGALYKYDITSKTWTDITPVSGDDLYFGFGGVAVDLQRPGTVMVAALNSWWPEGQIFRSTDGGASWSTIWSWGNWPHLNKHYSYSNSRAPWLGVNHVETEAGILQVGWMMEALVIDPFDSNHWLYGTGATIYGGHDLLEWDSKHNVTLESLADGVEETAILGLISPPSGPQLLSAVGDLGGFVHHSLSEAPAEGFKNPTWATSSDIDYAGKRPNIIVRVGTGDSSSGKQVAISSDSGTTWQEHYGAADNVSGGKIAISAEGDTILWRTSGNGVLVSRHMGSFTRVTSLPSSAAIASDKLENNIFYAAAGSSFYVSTDHGTTFVQRGSLGDSESPFQVAVNTNQTGDIWVSTDKGLFHSTDSGESFTQIEGITQAWSVSLGAPAASEDYPTIFVAANIDGIAYFRSDDAGVTWARINDEGRGFGTPSANCLVADSRVHGRVYIGTNGRGIFYGDLVAA